MTTLTFTRAQWLEIIDALANQRADMRAAMEDSRIERIRADINKAINESFELSQAIREAIDTKVTPEAERAPD